MNDEAASAPRSSGALAALLGVALLAFAGFTALGVWQLHRLAWKQDLLARIDRQLHAAPVPASSMAAWSGLAREAAEYRRVELRGVYDPGRDVRVHATTEFGAGYWVMTPMRSAEGFDVFVNRGFVPLDAPGARLRAPEGDQHLVGLLRMSEPTGSLLQHNDAAHDRWYSRDVPALAAARHVAGPVAPYFIDAAAGPGAAPIWPRPGLTVLRFSNNHRVYAATWFALAAMVACAAAGLVRYERRLRRLAGDPRLVHTRP